MRDINEVIRRKQGQQAQLREQIEALQAAARDLEAVQHLLQEEDVPMSASRGAGN